jgi:hypothetical protein
MPSTLAGSGDSAKESRDNAQLSSETTGSNTTVWSTTTNNTASTTDTQLPPNQAIAAEGNWQFILNDTVVRNLVVTLLQKENDVYGAGKIKEGNSTLDVAVSGKIANSTMELNLVSTNPIVQYKLDLDIDGNRATGKYQASSAAGDSWTGSVEGEKTA